MVGMVWGWLSLSASSVQPEVGAQGRALGVGPKAVGMRGVKSPSPPLGLLPCVYPPNERPQALCLAIGGLRMSLLSALGQGGGST